MATAKVHAQTWNGLTAAQQSEIKQILSASGLVDDVVPDAAAAAPAATATVAPHALGGGVCSIICTVVEQVAKLACQKLQGAAKEICLAGAEQGAALCRAKCH